MATVAFHRAAVGAPAVLLVGNAKAGEVEHRPELLESATAALRDAGARVESHLTHSLRELGAVMELAEGRRLVVLGGDGSLHALANLAEPPREIALLPAGSANNIAVALGIPFDLKEAARLAVEGRARSVDGIEAVAEGVRYTALEGVSVGFLARARVRYRSEGSSHTWEGLRVGLAELAGFRPIEVDVVVDGDAETLTVGQLFVANMPRYAFALRVARADPFDGLLDVVAVGARGRARLVAAIAGLRRGTLELPSRRAERVVLRPHGSPVVADSRSLGYGLVALAAKPGAVQVVAP